MDYPELSLGFSISATSRRPREGERHGIDYYFLSDEDFSAKVNNNEFIEWEEVYAGTRYGTLESEITRLTDEGKNVIMDVDVKGALNIKKRYGDSALSLFIMPPDLDSLAQRLKGRNTDSDEMIAKRLEKAAFEIGFSNEFDSIVINGDLDLAVAETNHLITQFISS